MAHGLEETPRDTAMHPNDTPRNMLRQKIAQGYSPTLAAALVNSKLALNNTKEH